MFQCTKKNLQIHSKAKKKKETPKYENYKKKD